MFNSNSCGPRYYWTFYIRVWVFPLAKLRKNTTFTVKKMYSITVNSIFAVQNNVTYQPLMTRETWAQFHQQIYVQILRP